MVRNANRRTEEEATCSKVILKLQAVVLSSGARTRRESEGTSVGYCNEIQFFMQLF